MVMVAFQTLLRRQCVRVLSIACCFPSSVASCFIHSLVRRLTSRLDDTILTRRNLMVTCSTTEETAQAVKRIVQPGQTVAELGSSLRLVSTTICQCLNGRGRAILVDTQRSAPKTKADNNNAQSMVRTKEMRVPGDEVDFFREMTEFYEIQALDEWKTTFLRASTSYHVLVLDVTSIVGNDLELTSFSLAREFLTLFDQCQHVILKSATLNVFANRLVHGQRWIASKEREIGQDESSMGGVPASSRYNEQGKIITTVGVKQYREMIPHTVFGGEAVLEIGCHLGTTTSMLHKAAGINGYAIGVDVGVKIIQGAKDRYPNVPFAVGDAWKTAELLRIQQDVLKTSHPTQARQIGFDVVYVDVGGLSGSDGVLEAFMLLSNLMNGLEPRYLVIKSLCLRRLSSTLVPYWEIQKSNMHFD